MHPSSLVPRRGGGGGERMPGTHCLRMRLIATEFHGDHVRACMYLSSDIINLPHCWCSVGVTFILRCSRPSGS